MLIVSDPEGNITAKLDWLVSCSQLVETPKLSNKSKNPFTVKIFSDKSKDSVTNKFAKLGDAIAISKSETITH